MRAGLIAALLCLWATIASAQVAFDASAGAGASVDSTVTTNLTVGTLTNGAMIFGISCTSPFAPTVSSITWNGASTGVTAITATAANTGNFYTWQYRLVAPTSGTHAAVLTMSNLCATLVLGVATFSGVDQTTPATGGATATGSGTSQSIPAVTCTTGDMVQDTVVTEFMATVVAGQTQEWNQSPNDFGSGSRKAGAASVSMGWTTGPPSTWAMSASCIKQAAAPAAGGTRMTLTGVGR